MNEKSIANISDYQKADTQNSHSRACKLLQRIFSEILPDYGMELRENQLAISLFMLEAMEKNKVALCEAEVGTGKTYAYLLAAVVYRLFHAGRMPVVISTSTIALQRALTEEYIPQISDILREHHIIAEPLTFAVRKGKSHYACDNRVKTYLASVRHNNRPEDQELIEILTALFAGASAIDLDGLKLTDYVKRKICVDRCQYTCGLSSVCRYRTLIKSMDKSGIDFQIANHNYVLADVLSQKSGRKRLLPRYCTLIFDEAHKVVDAARQMYGTSFGNMELERLAFNISHVAVNHPEKKKVIRICEEMLRKNMAFFENLRESVQDNRRDLSIQMTSYRILIVKDLISVLTGLSTLFFTADNRNIAYRRIAARIEKEQEKLRQLLDYAQSIYWLERQGIAVWHLCALPKQLDFLLHEDIWSKEEPYLLTSATLSVDGDFSHLMQQTGIDFLQQERIAMISKSSPFDYENHGLLYLPNDMPRPDVRDRIYINAVIDRLEELIRHTYGHTLVLFTSYRLMEISYQELSARITSYPLFCMGKGRLEAIKAFRESGNGVLLASDTAGEGIDLAGDILSSLVVIKLPFPIPDPVLEYEKSLYEDFFCYLSESIVPSMLMKLRQWIGRGIRRETDTCVFSILDCRASERYKNDILAALPDMPVTDNIEDVGIFIRSHKPESYFVDSE